MSELNLEEGGAFTVSSAEEILSGKAPSGCDCDSFHEQSASNAER